MNEKNTNALPVITIPEPCPMAWSELNGDAKKRFCDQCTKHVFNFAEMPEAEVNEILCSGKSVCAQVTRRKDGSIVTLESRSQKRRFKIPFLENSLRRIAIAATGVLSLVSFGGCSEETIERLFPWTHNSEEQIMGDVACPPPSPELGKIAPPDASPTEGAKEAGDGEANVEVFGFVHLEKE